MKAYVVNQHKKPWRNLAKLIPLCLGEILGSSVAVQSQVIPDHTLPNNSIVIPQDNLSIIEGGTVQENNLFHSFTVFSVQQGQGVVFNNNSQIQNIFSRVTGQSPSYIDGLITANGTANLFLINPNGITFGPNTVVNLGGSFWGTTADSVLFDNGQQFNASFPQQSILSVNAPIGLLYQPPVGDIIILGKGHQLVPSSSNAISSPIIGSGIQESGLRVSPFKNLLLLGGNIKGDGGIINAFSGNIDLISIKQGLLTFNLKTNTFDYSQVAELGNINLINKSLIDASGISNGTIQLVGDKILLGSGSAIIVSNFGNQDVGNISLKADSIELTQVIGGVEALSSSGNFSGIISQNFTTSRGSNIVLETNNLALNELGAITAINVANGQGGNIDITALNMKVTGSSKVFPSSFLVNSNFQEGQGGDIYLNVQKLTLENNGVISAFNFGRGQSGKINVNSNSLTIIGNPNSTTPSSIGTINFGDGQGGALNIQANYLRVSNSGVINSTTVGNGNAGSIFIKAEQLEVENSQNLWGQNINQSSRISASADIPLALISAEFQLAPPTGNSGNIEIQAKTITLTNGGRISITNQGSGSSGTLNLKANEIRLNNSEINADSVSGEGGNINLQTFNLRLNNSTITATAEGTGNGGNINLTGDTILLFNNSKITANSFAGKGGNISLNSQFLFLSPDSAITASSELGIDGVVEINTPENALQSGLSPLNVSLSAPAEVINGTCLDPSRLPTHLTRSGGLPSEGEDYFELPQSYPQGDVKPADKIVAMPNGDLVGFSQLRWQKIEEQLCPN